MMGGRGTIILISLVYSLDFVNTDTQSWSIRCPPDNFDRLLCPVGSAIKVTDLLVGSRPGDTCPVVLRFSDCIADVSGLYLDTYRSLCDGRVSCEGSYSINSTTQCGDRNTYTWLSYSCTAPDSAIRHTETCSGAPVDSEFCPDDSSIHVLSVYAGLSQNNTCNSTLHDCVVRVDDIQMYRDQCDGRQACDGLTAPTVNYNFCNINYRSSTYIMIVYRCNETLTGVTVAVSVVMTFLVTVVISVPLTVLCVRQRTKSNGKVSKANLPTYLSRESHPTAVYVNSEVGIHPSDENLAHTTDVSHTDTADGASYETLGPQTFSSEPKTYESMTTEHVEGASGSEYMNVRPQDSA